MPNRSYRRWAAVLLTGWSLGFLPGLASAESLREALAATYETNPELEGGRAQLRAIDEGVAQARAGRLPSIFANGTIEGARGAVDGPNGATKRTTKQVGVSIRQPLYAGGSIGANIRRAEGAVSAEQANLIALEQRILVEAVDAYTATWQDKSVLNLALNNEQRLRRQQQAARDRFNVGEIARTDVAQADARLARASSDVEAAKSNLAASRAAYRRVIGQDPGVLQDPMRLKEVPASVDEALMIAGDNPQIAAANFDLATAREDVLVARSDILPSLDLTSDFNYADQPNYSVPWQREAAIGIQLSIPLYQGGADYSRVRQSREQLQQARSSLETAQRSVQANVAASYDRLYAAGSAIRSYQAEVRANRVALEGVQQEALVGSRTVLDVLDAEQELFTSQINLVRAQRDEVLASYQLKASVGELTVADLKLENVTVYDPQAYYKRSRSRIFGIMGD